MMFRLIRVSTIILCLFAAIAVGHTAEPAAKVSVSEVSAKELAEALKAQKGKVVLVDCWALWCAPCIKKFPHFVELQKKYGEKGLVCVSISLDKLGADETFKQESVLKFLKDKGAEFPNFILAEPKKDEDALVKILGEFTAVPYMAMFDRSGRRVWVSDEKKLTDEQLNKLIEENLAEKP